MKNRTTHDTDTDTGGTPDPLTPEQMIAAWRQLLKDGCSVEWKPALEPSVCIYAPGSIRAGGKGTDPDPLLAFTRAWRAFREGTAGKE